jgi:hypothetical protein
MGPAPGLGCLSLAPASSGGLRPGCLGQRRRLAMEVSWPLTPSVEPMSDSLRDLGELVSDRTLNINLLCGLNRRYDHLKAFIKRFVPFHDELLLKELILDVESATSAMTL